MHRIGVAVTLLCAATLATIPTVAAAQDVGTITLVAQERILEARTSAPPRLESFVEPGPGIIRTVRRIEEGRQVCAPRGGCSTVPYTVSRSEQRTAINMAPNGALHVQGYQQASAARDSGSFSGASARSRSTISFSVEGSVPFALRAEGRGRASVALTGEAGVVFDYRDLSALPYVVGGVHTTGRLPAGTYTLVVDASAAGTATDFEETDLEVRFVAGGEPAARPQCRAEADHDTYVVGDIVTSGWLVFYNPRPEPIPVEVKLWLRRPSGEVTSAYNAGADGSESIPNGLYAFGSQIMGVDDQLEKGIWELGCRLLDPSTGVQLAEDSDLFEIR
jgi:hypothetical protein